MTPIQYHRFETLKAGEWVSQEYINEYYGLKWPFQDDLFEDFKAWAKVTSRQEDSLELVSRYQIESFMQHHRVIPHKWMSARLGMTSQSLGLLLGKLRILGMHPQRYNVYLGFISESLPDDLIRNLGSLRFRTFSDHNSFCERLHAEIDKSLELKVDPLFCTTSDRLEDYPKQFAINFDCITLEPVSGKHQMWLNFGKPLYLAPDRCSKLLYAENYEILSSCRSCRLEPGNLDLYQQFLSKDQVCG
ncbi:MAG: hypothetical protein WCJ40_04370 [Planctomycetota bacterium]